MVRTVHNFTKQVQFLWAANSYASVTSLSAHQRSAVWQYSDIVEAKTWPQLRRKYGTDTSLEKYATASATGYQTPQHRNECSSRLLVNVFFSCRSGVMSYSLTLTRFVGGIHSKSLNCQYGMQHYWKDTQINLSYIGYTNRSLRGYNNLRR